MQGRQTKGSSLIKNKNSLGGGEEGEQYTAGRADGVESRRSSMSKKQWERVGR